MFASSARRLAKTIRQARPLLGHIPARTMADEKGLKPQKPRGMPDSIVQAVDKLDRTLQKEIAYENENKPPNEEAVKTLRDKGWEVSNDGSLYELRKKAADSEVTITFTVRSPTPEKDDEKDDAKAEQSPDIAEFSAYVRRPGRRELLVAEYLCTGTEVGLRRLRSPW